MFSKKILIMVLAFVIMFSATGCGYNKSIDLEESVKAQWSQIDVQLKRRYDLIPNLIEAVKGYAKHEKDLFIEIANARKAYFSAKTTNAKVKSATQLEGVLSRLLMLKETYPNLKANESFLKLQDSLEGTENRIAVERKRYNDAVKNLNSYIRGIPGKWWADMTGVGKAEYFEVKNEAVKEAPKVKF